MKKEKRFLLKFEINNDGKRKVFVEIQQHHRRPKKNLKSKNLLFVYKITVRETREKNVFLRKHFFR